MADVNETNTNNQTNENNNQNQQNSQNNNNNNQQNSSSQNTQNNNSVDTEKIKKDAIADYFKNLGYSEEELNNIISEHKKTVDANKTELEKSQDVVKNTTQKLAEERKARIVAEAKVAAITAGVNPKILDDFVIIAMNKAIADKKDVSEVISEMKKSESSSVYFVTEEEDKNKNNNQNNVTRKRVQKQNNNNNNDEEDNGTHAYRIMKNKQTGNKKSSFFSN